jgi:hypothetical protein
MSAVASDAKPAQEPGPQVESDGDRFETLIEYEPSAKVPKTVMLVWLCAVVGLGAYLVNLYLPELALWGKP